MNFPVHQNVKSPIKCFCRLYRAKSVVFGHGREGIVFGIWWNNRNLGQCEATRTISRAKRKKSSVQKAQSIRAAVFFVVSKSFACDFFTWGGGLTNREQNCGTTAKLATRVAYTHQVNEGGPLPLLAGVRRGKEVANGETQDFSAKQCLRMKCWVPSLRWHSCPRRRGSDQRFSCDTTTF